MSRMQRDKGARGERELFALLSDELGFVVTRNVDQFRNERADCIEIPGWAVECKRHETEAVNQWWNQAVEQAGALRKPVLFWRASRQPWKAVMFAHDVAPDVFPRGDAVLMMHYKAAATVIRSSLK